MPDRLTLPVTLLLVGVALGLAFGAQVLLSAGASTANPRSERPAALVQSRLGSDAAVGLSAVWAVPALRAPRASAARTVRSPRIESRGAVTPAVSLVSVPVTPDRSSRTTPVATPSPRTQVRTPSPKPQPTPAATPEPSHRFDSSTEGNFDTTGEAAQTPAPTQTSDDGATK
jgi:hypothetical protein